MLCSVTSGEFPRISGRVGMLQKQSTLQISTLYVFGLDPTMNSFIKFIIKRSLPTQRLTTYFTGKMVPMLFSKFLNMIGDFLKCYSLFILLGKLVSQFKKQNL